MMKFSILITLMMFGLVACSTPKKTNGETAKGQSEKPQPIKGLRPPEVVQKITQSSTDPLVSVSCSVDQDHREIRSLRTADGGCEVSYMKSTGTTVIGSAISDLEYCRNLVQQVRGNLENSGFTCK